LAPPTDSYRRRHAVSPAADQRDPGQRDRDRVLYTYAIRRLAGVTQVVAPIEGQIFHNRLTHSLEVAQLARRIAEKLRSDYPRLSASLGGIDPDVAEAAALVHDLGHPPFGHVAERELDRVARSAGDPDGFEGNAQSFRIATKLAAHSELYPGLNLCRCTLNAVLKYPWLRKLGSPSSRKYKKFGAYRTEATDFRFARSGFRASDRKSLEAAIMDYADGLAYSVHDLDDFYRAGLLSVEHLKVSSIEFDGFLTRWIRSGQVTAAEVGRSRSGLYNLLLDTFYFTERFRNTFQHRAQLRTVTSNLIRDYVYAVRLQTPTGSGSGLNVQLTKNLELKFFQRIVWEYVISNPNLATQQHGQRTIIRTLFAVYLEATRERNSDLTPALFLDELDALGGKPRRKRRPNRAEIRLAVDIVASFTDSQASNMFRRLSGVASGSVADFLER
jgi:dGTPase